MEKSIIHIEELTKPSGRVTIGVSGDQYMSSLNWKKCLMIGI
jgi:hypothetical protein